MARSSTAQIAVKPQDLYVLFALLTRQNGAPTYAQLGAQTGMSPSAVHASMKRVTAAGLAIHRDGKPAVLKPQLREFVFGGAKYVFPAMHGRIGKGVPTSYAAPALSGVIAPTSDPVPVWAHKSGSVRGVSLAPLYPTVPVAALRDANLYAVLSLFDAYRSGQARERAAAQKLLDKYFQ